MGQIGFLPDRYRVVDYLPYMNLYEFFLASEMPKPVPPYFTMIYPFDGIVWAMTASVVLGVALALWIIEGFSRRVTGLRTAKNYIFKGQ